MKNKRILITGGTGSFGSTMVKSLVEQDCEEIRIFSRDELKQHEMRRSLRGLPVTFHIGDVRDVDSLHRSTEGIDQVFHAAALKQVPSCEFFPLEALRTNALGSQNVLDAATKAGCESVVLLSTDKAVAPLNAMGMTKAIMEKLAFAHAMANPSGPVISVVRYGNVMMSRGSVIPLFLEQVRAGLPITITNPEMTRFLMPLADAVGLVQHALVNAQSGDLFINKAKATSVAILADAVRQFCGSPEHPIKIIGTRHAEKLFEVLATAEELRRAEDQGEFFRIPADSRDMNYDVFYDEGDAAVDLLDELNSQNVRQLGVEETVALLEKVAS